MEDATNQAVVLLVNLGCRLGQEQGRIAMDPGARRRCTWCVMMVMERSGADLNDKEREQRGLCVNQLQDGGWFTRDRDASERGGRFAAGLKISLRLRGIFCCVDCREAIRRLD